MRTVYILFLNILFLNSFITAQNLVSIQGKLIDSTNRVQITGAIIQVSVRSTIGKESKMTLLSNNIGLYKFPATVDANVKLVVASLGYQNESVYFNVQKDTSITIIMKPSPRKLKEVIVKESTSIQFSVIPGGITINPDLKAFTPSTGLPIFLKYVPGLTISPKGAISFLDKALKVYVDGRLLNLSGPELLNYLSQLTVKDLGTIDILTEPGASYDASSGSIINLHIKKFASIGLQDIIGVGLTSHDKAYINNTTVYSKSQFKVVGNILANHSNFFDNNFYAISSPNRPELNATQILNYEGTPQNNLALRLGFDARIKSKLQIGLNLSGSIAESNYGYNYLLTNTKGSQTIPSKYLSNTRRDRESGYLQYEMKKGVFQVDFSRVNQHDNSKISNYFSNSQSLSEILNSNNSTNNNYFINAKQNIKVRDYFLINFGIKFSNNHLYNTFQSSSSGFEGYTDYREKISAAFFETSFNSKNFGFQAGLRGENTDIDVKTKERSNDYNYTNFFPNIILSFPNFIKLKSFLYFNTSITRPNYTQYLQFPENINVNSVSYNVGNAFLQPATVRAIGLKFNRSFKSELSVLLNISKSTVISTITSIPFITNNVIATIPLNLNDAHIYSAELMISKRWKSINLTIAPKYERRDLNYSTVSYEDQIMTLKLSKANYYAVFSTINFPLFKYFNNAINVSYGSKQYSPLGYRKGSGYSSYSINRSFLKNRLSSSLELADPFNWSRNFTNQFFNGVNFTSNNKPETRMLYISLSYTLGTSKRSKATRYNYEDDSRLKNIRL